jgi:endonuclease YncB( thermonuclease family)
MWDYLVSGYKVVDGDTYILDIDLGFYVYTRQSIRLKGAYCPELSEAGGNEARIFVQVLFDGNPDKIIVVTEKVPTRSFARYVARVFVNGKDLAKILIDGGYATTDGKGR